jgi:glycerophosphoryl diester phosphodiesterase
MSGELPFLIYAHRLGTEYGPESARSSLEHSLTGNPDGVEADVVISADGQVVVLHDPYLPLSTNLEGWAHERDADELKRARLLDADDTPSEESPMVLDELIELVPDDLTLQIDVKAYADVALAKTTTAAACRTLRCRGRTDGVEILSFFSSACAESVEQGFDTRLVVWADYAPDALADWVSGQRMVGVSFEGFILTPKLVAPLYDAGLTLSVGAINARAQLEPLLPLEPQIIVSDRPLELRDEASDLVAGL